MDDLIAFLRARLDERETALRALAEKKATDSYNGLEMSLHTEMSALASSLPWPQSAPSYEYAAWQYMLADVDAKRQIIDDHTTPHTVVDGFCVEEGGPCTHAGESWCSWHETHGCSTVRLLALPDAGHPDYRPEWRP